MTGRAAFDDGRLYELRRNPAVSRLLIVVIAGATSGNERDTGGDDGAKWLHQTDGGGTRTRAKQGRSSNPELLRVLPESYTAPRRCLAELGELYPVTSGRTARRIETSSEVRHH